MPTTRRTYPPEFCKPRLELRKQVVRLRWFGTCERQTDSWMKLDREWSDPLERV